MKTIILLLLILLTSCTMEPGSVTTAFGPIIESEESEDETGSVEIIIKED